MVRENVREIRQGYDVLCGIKAAEEREVDRGISPGHVAEYFRIPTARDAGGYPQARGVGIAVTRKAFPQYLKNEYTVSVLFGVNFTGRLLIPDHLHLQPMDWTTRFI